MITCSRCTSGAKRSLFMGINILGYEHLCNECLPIVRNQMLFSSRPRNDAWVELHERFDRWAQAQDLEQRA